MLHDIKYASTSESGFQEKLYSNIACRFISSSSFKNSTLLGRRGRMSITDSYATLASCRINSSTS